MVGGRMMGRGTKGLGLGIALALTVVVAGIGASDALAVQRGNDDGRSFGAWIYEGTCDALSSRPLDEIGDLEVERGMAQDLALTPPAPSTIYGEDEDIDATYASLARSPHAVVVRASEDSASDVIACGEIANVPAGDDPFSVELKTVNDSGYTGVARFALSDDDDEVQVTVGIWEGTSSATPAAGTPAA